MGTNNQKVRAGASALGHYFADIRKYPVLDREQEIALCRDVKEGKPGAYDRLVESNLRFVVKVARDHLGMGLPLEDLINEGNIGLMDAANRFDPDRGVRFITCAVWWIRRSIRTALTTQSHDVRLPGSQLKRMREARGISEGLRDELGREPTNDELVERLPANLAKDASLYNGIRMAYLDEPPTEGGRPALAEVLGDEQQTSAEEQVLRSERVARVRAACDLLDDKQREVVAARFGLEDDTRMTLDEVGKRIGRSRERVRQIERQAVKSLRHKMLASGRTWDRPPTLQAS